MLARGFRECLRYCFGRRQTVVVSLSDWLHWLLGTVWSEAGFSAKHQQLGLHGECVSIFLCLNSGSSFETFLLVFRSIVGESHKRES